MQEEAPQNRRWGGWQRQVWGGAGTQGLAKAGAGTTAPSHTQAPEQLAVGLAPLSKARHLSSKKMEQRA